MKVHQAGLTPFDAAAIIVVLVALVGFANQRLVRLPPSIAMTTMGAFASLVVIIADYLIPGRDLSARFAGFLNTINFQETLINGMLSFLLFAGALHVNWTEMQRGRWPILVLSTLGVLLSTALIGGGFYLLAPLLGVHIEMIWCLVFGALISPTDPVAVMGVLKRTACPPTLQATVAGESLFNDGVGVVVFSILLSIAIAGGGFSAVSAAQSFVVEAGGGVVVGLAVGWVGYIGMRDIDDFNVELMISLAIVMGGYSICRWLGVSGPVAMAVAGLLIGNAGVAYAMTESTRDHVLKFWALIDELLNAVLFLLIGLELVAIAPAPRLALLGLLTVPVALLARAISVILPLAGMRSMRGPATFPTLVWGGLRGGISVALALSLPNGPEKPLILTTTYVIVLFSVLVQGGSIARLLKRLATDPPCAPELVIHADTAVETETGKA